MASYLDSVDMFQAGMLFLRGAKVLRSATPVGAIPPQSQATLIQVRDFLLCVDWDGTETVQFGFAPSPEIATQAISIGPVFFETIVGMQEEFLAAGVNNRATLNEFFLQFYKVLTSCDSFGALQPAYRKLAIDLLSKISDGLLQEIRYASSIEDDSMLCGR